MPWYEGEHVELVRASVDACFGALTDYPRMVEWQKPLQRCEVVSRRPDGRAELVDYEISTPIRSVSYRLRHSYDEPHEVTGVLVEGDVKGFEGRWRFRAAGNGESEVAFELRIDPGFWVPKRVTKLLHETVMKRAVADLKRHLES